jgi:SAM-dependent methyltransferase
VTSPLNSSRVARKAQKAAGILYYALLRLSAGIFGFKPRHRAEDRRILDERILPRLATNPRFARVLFVGCDWYTEHVEGLFAPTGREYTTIEIDPDRAGHGARRHIVGALADLARHFPEGSLDLIICNGVIGWGLNDPAEIERSMAACAAALSPGGVLLLGWDDVPEKLPVAIGAIHALRALHPAAPQGFEQPVIETGTYTRHTFGFWQKSLN